MSRMLVDHGQIASDLDDQKCPIELSQRHHFSVREVHHRIKNNLQGVVGLLRQHAARQPAAAPLLDTAITQVNAVAIVHGLHGRSRDEQLLMCDMVHAIGEAVAGLHGARVEMAFVPHMPLGIAVLPAEAVPLALIVNEMVINAIKHGGEQVWLDLRQEGSAIVVEARNPGQLENDIDVASGRALGTGLSLVRALLPLQGATFVLRNDGANVVAQLRLCRRITATVRAFDLSGVEMEALAAVSAAALTVYDMCKAIDRGRVIAEIRLDEKRGGKSGTWKRRAVSTDVRSTRRKPAKTR